MQCLKRCFQYGNCNFPVDCNESKSKEREGKVQLIDATKLKSPLRKNLGEKNCEFTKDIRKQILKIYMILSPAKSVRYLIMRNSAIGRLLLTGLYAMKMEIL